MKKFLRRWQMLVPVAIVAIALNSGAHRAWAATIFQDNFTAPPLSNSWTWNNPNNDASYQISNGFTMTIPAGDDQWVNIDKAPRLLTSQPGTTWTMETHITQNTGNTNTFGGLVLYGDAANWILWGQLGNNSLETSGLINNTFTNPIGSMTTKYSYFRVRRVNSDYFFDASSDGTHWTNANVFNDTTGALSSANIGFLFKNWNAAGGQSAIMSFGNFTLDNTDLMPNPLSTTVSTTQIAQETGYNSINNTQNVSICGTDLGEMFNWQGKTFFTFGDTDRCDGSAWPPNSLAYSSSTNPVSGILFDGWLTSSNGESQAMFPADAGAITSIPTNGVGISSNAYVYYMDVNNWNPAPPVQWTCSGSSLATANSSNIALWAKEPSVSWGANSNFNVVAVSQQGSTLYIWGDPCGRDGSIELMKVSTASVLTKSAYRYFSGYNSSGSPTWSSSESNAVTVAGGPAGELSVMYDSWLGRYVMTYLDNNKQAIVLRDSPNPWGPWSAPIQIATASQWPVLYGAFMDPTYVGNNGQTIYYMMSQYGPYNTFWMQTTLQQKTNVRSR